MLETVIKATERIDSLKKVRSAGFIPGVLNGPGTASTSVMFEAIPLRKVITKHGKNAKVWIEYGNEKIFGFIKDIQRHPVEANILHVVVHLVTKDQEVKMQLPITFNGQEALEHKFMYVQVYKSDIEILGQTDKIPDSIVIDISGKVSGDNITAPDFNLPPELKVLDAENEIYAVIKGSYQVAKEEPKEVNPA